MRRIHGVAPEDFEDIMKLMGDRAAESLEAIRMDALSSCAASAPSPGAALIAKRYKSLEEVSRIFERMQAPQTVADYRLALTFEEMCMINDGRRLLSLLSQLSVSNITKGG